MKTFRNLIITLFFIALSATDTFCQPGPPGGGGPGGPPCWPPSTCDPEIPINGELWILLIAALTLSYYFLKKRINPEE